MSKAQRWTEADLKAIVGKRQFKEIADSVAPNKQSKYRNRKVTLDGIEFDSAKESRRWAELKAMQQAGLIHDLRTQQPIRCEINGFDICTWIADFTYLSVETGKRVYEDVKSEVTRRLPVFRLKKKLVEALHGIEIIET